MKKLLCVLSILLTLFCLLAEAENEVFSDGRYTYKLLEDGTAGICGMEWTENIENTEITIPETVDGYPVSTILFNAFSNWGLTSVVIPEGVVTIEADAFSSNYSLKRVVLPSTLKKIDMFAFALCYQLADFQLPDSLEYIGSYAFVECSSLRDVAIPNGLAYYGKNVFEGCISQDPAFADCRTEGSYQYQILADSFAVLIHYDGQEEEVLLPETLAGYPLIEIRSYAFEGKENLKHISLPDSLLRIGEGAFIGCRQLTKVDFSPRLTAIEGYAFAYCTSLSDVILPPSMIDCGENVFEGCISTPDHIEYEGNGTSLPLIEKERGDYVYYLLADSLAVLTKYTGASEALVLPDTLDGYPLYRIDAYAFDENETLKSITLPKSLREVKANSFSGCRRLKKLIFTAPMNADMLESIKSFDLDIVYIPENK